MAAKRPFAELDWDHDERQCQQVPPGSQLSPPMISTGIASNQPEMKTQWSHRATHPERTLPLPSSIASNIAGLQSLPPLTSSWSPDRTNHAAHALSQPVMVPQGTQISPDVKLEATGSVTMHASFPTSGSESDQAAEGTPTPAATLSAEELQRLKAKMVNLQAQVEDFRQQLNLVQQHAAAKDAQYAQIIEQSTRRESQSLAESKRWRADRDRWTEERQVLQDTIAHLTSKLQDLQGDIGTSSATGITQTERHTRSTTTHMMSIDHTSLHERELEPPASSDGTPLENLRQESSHIIEHGTRLVEVGKRIEKQLDELQKKLA